MDFFRHFLLAVQFFTRIPVTGRLAAWVGFSPQMLQRCAAHFPAIGWLMGAAAAAVLAVALDALRAQPYAPLVAAVLATITTVWLTGGFHEDGLADTCDGLGGGATREKALHIMKDSRIGSYGTLALVLHRLFLRPARELIEADLFLLRGGRFLTDLVRFFKVEHFKNAESTGKAVFAGL